MTIDCDRARLAIGAEPATLPQDLAEGVAAHLATCAACAGYRAEMRRMEEAIHTVLAAEPDLGCAGRQQAPRSAPLSRWRSPPARIWALAASVLGAVGLGLFLLLSRPDEALASAVVEHLSGEPASWHATQPVPPAILTQVLAQSGVHLDRPGAGDIVYAHSCWFRNHYVPHLVVRTRTGPVTVLVLPAERVERSHSFDEGGYRGLLVPAGTGGLAVLGEVSDAAPTPDDLREAADRVRAALGTN